MTWLIILILLLGGLILLLLELLVVPGTTVVGVIGFVLMAVGIWQSYVGYGWIWGSMILFITLLISIGGLYYSLRSNTWNKAMLKTSIHSRVNTEAVDLIVGTEGRTSSVVNPMGKALFDNKYYEVSSYGEFIESDQEVKIIAIDGNKIFISLNA